jgi:hypothetical protein
MHIKPLSTLTREEIADLARNAADNSEPLHVACAFPQDSQQCAWFTQAYLEQRRDLARHAA